MGYEKFDLRGKTALITGGAGLLGQEHALALLESGAHIILTDVNEPKLKSSKRELTKNYKKSNVTCYLMDITQRNSILEVKKKLAFKKSRIDILINNAAIDAKITNLESDLENSRLENFSLEQWNLEINVGLTGAFLCSQIFGSLMAMDNLGGVILNIASDLSVISPDQRLYRNDSVSENQQPVKPVTYSVIKAGLIGLTKYLATYWPDRGIRCNALSPGGVFNNQRQEFVDRIEKLIPMGRMAAKTEYRGAIQFLCSPASSYMNGQNIVIDGGRSII